VRFRHSGYSASIRRAIPRPEPVASIRRTISIAQR
jgi:hypothetical protein